MERKLKGRGLSLVTVSVSVVVVVVVRGVLPGAAEGGRTAPPGAPPWAADTSVSVTFLTVFD